MEEQKDLFENEFDRLYGPSYRQGEGHCAPTRPENRFDEAPASVESLNPKADDAAKELAEQVVPKEHKVEVFNHPVTDYINTITNTDLINTNISND